MQNSACFFSHEEIWAASKEFSKLLLRMVLGKSLFPLPMSFPSLNSTSHPFHNSIFLPLQQNFIHFVGSAISPYLLVSHHFSSITIWFFVDLNLIYSYLLIFTTILRFILFINHILFPVLHWRFGLHLPLFIIICLKKKAFRIKISRNPEAKLSKDLCQVIKISIHGHVGYFLPVDLPYDSSFVVGKVGIAGIS